MCAYHTLEKDTYDAIVAVPFELIPSPCTWFAKENLREQVQKSAMKQDVHYACAGDFGLLGSVTVPTRYTEDTDLVWIDPEKPLPLHPDAAAATAAQAKILASQNDQDQKSYAVWKGAQKGWGENIRRALPADHTEELEEDLYGWKRVTV